MIIIFWLWRFGSWFVGHAPVRLTRAAAGRLGSAGYWLLGNSRRDAISNYAQVMGKHESDPAVSHVARNAFRNFAKYLLEVLRFPYLSDAELDQRVVLHEGDEFRQALARKKGVIFVSAHFGNMELAGVQLAKKYARMTLAAEVLKAKQVYEWLVENRAKHNVRLIPYQQAARSVISALRSNEFVGFFLDLGIKYDHKGVPVRFFGRTAYFPAAPALLSHRTGAPIIQGYAVVAPDGLIHGHAFPTIYPDTQLDRDNFVRYATQQMANNMEQFIGKNPEQWYIFRRIWPDGAPSMEAAEPQSLSVQAS